MNRSGLFWGSLLILLGVLFLLSSLGILTVSVWSIFWPLVFVLGGLWLLISGLQRPRPSPPQRVTMQLKGVEAADIRIRHGGGHLDIDSDCAPEELLDGVFSSGLDYDLEEVGSDRALLTLRPHSDPGASWRADQRTDWDISLNSLIPLTLDLETGGGETTADLRDMRVTDLKIRTGASRVTVTLPQAVPMVDVSVEGGATALTLIIPDNVAARIRAESAISGLTIDEGRFPLTNGLYQSPDFETASNRAEIRLVLGAGFIEIQ